MHALKSKQTSTCAFFEKQDTPATLLASITPAAAEAEIDNHH
jgi:hypothetical protein